MGPKTSASLYIERIKATQVVDFPSLYTHSSCSGMVSNSSKGIPRFSVSTKISCKSKPWMQIKIRDPSTYEKGNQISSAKYAMWVPAVVVNKLDELMNYLNIQFSIRARGAHKVTKNLFKPNMSYEHSHTYKMSNLNFTKKSFKLKQSQAFHKEVLIEQSCIYYTKWSTELELKDIEFPSWIYWNYRIATETHFAVVGKPQFQRISLFLVLTELFP